MSTLCRRLGIAVAVDSVCGRLSLHSGAIKPASLRWRVSAAMRSAHVGQIVAGRPAVWEGGSLLCQRGRRHSSIRDATSASIVW
jgi:hypothetical protein